MAGADANDEPANEAVVDAGFGFHLGAQLLAQGVDDGGLLGFGQRPRRDDFYLAGAAVAGDQAPISGDDRRQLRGAGSEPAVEAARKIR